MAFCKNCGADLQDATVCPSCGAAQETNATVNSAADKVKALNNTADLTSEMDPADITQNKVMAALSYLSWLVLIPLFAAKESPYARFHCNQGLVLAIVEIAWWVVQGILGTILAFIPGIGWLLSMLLGLVNIVFAVFAILGLINVFKGQAKELPLIGKYRILK